MPQPERNNQDRPLSLGLKYRMCYMKMLLLFFYSKNAVQVANMVHVVSWEHTTLIRLHRTGVSPRTRIVERLISWLVHASSSSLRDSSPFR